MKKILFVIQSYPSEKSANVYCDEKIMLSLCKDRNYEIHCLVSQYYKQPLEERINGLYIHRYSRGFFWHLFSWALKYNEKIRAKIIIKLNRVLLRIKQFFTIPFFPITQPILIRKTAKAAIKLQKKFCFDMVIAEHYGIETLYAGYRLKKCFPHIIFIPFLWDPITGCAKVKYLPLYFQKKKRENFEKRIINLSDCAVALKSHKEFLEKKFGGQELFFKYIFLDIPYFETTNKKKVDFDSFFSNDKVNIVYAGNMGLRDPTYLCKLLTNIHNCRIWFFTLRSDHKKLYEISEKYDVDIQICDYVPHEKMVNILHSADFFLNLGINNDNMVPSKIFEYMSYGKPIISTVITEDDPSIPYLNKYGKALIIKCSKEEKDVDNNLKKLKDFINKENDSEIDLDNLSYIFYTATPQAYVDLIKSVLEK